MIYEHKPNKQKHTVEYLLNNCREQTESLTKEDKEKVQLYLMWSPFINRWLSRVFRKVTIEPILKCCPSLKLDIMSKEIAKEEIEFLTALFDSRPLPISIMARRAIRADHYTIEGLDFRQFRNGEKDPSILVGKTYRERGFPFFSALLDDFRWLNEEVLVYAELPKGLKAIYLDPLRQIFQEHNPNYDGFGVIATQRGLTWEINEAWREGHTLKIRVRPIIGSNSPERLAKDLAEIR